MKLNKLGLIFAIGALVLIIGIAMPASAAENLTNASNETLFYDEEPEYVQPLFINTPEYQTEYDYWVSYYRSQNQPTPEQILAYLTDETHDEDTRFSNVLSYIGRSDSLITYLDDTKRTINEYTGTVTYNLGFFNGFFNLFGAGIDADSLPQNIAQGNALYDVYKEHYNLFVDVMRELDNE